MFHGAVAWIPARTLALCHLAPFRGNVMAIEQALSERHQETVFFSDHLPPMAGPG